jgi:hypothetical protein
LGLLKNLVAIDALVQILLHLNTPVANDLPQQTIQKTYNNTA